MPSISIISVVMIFYLVLGNPSGFFVFSSNVTNASNANTPISSFDVSVAPNDDVIANTCSLDGQDGEDGSPGIGSNGGNGGNGGKFICGIANGDRANSQDYAREETGSECKTNTGIANGQDGSPGIGSNGGNGGDGGNIVC